MNVQVHVEKKTWNTSIVLIIEVHVILDSGEMSLVLCLSLQFSRDAAIKNSMKTATQALTGLPSMILSSF